MSRKVKFARIHSATHVEGIGTIDSVIPSKSKTLPGLEMTYDALGLHVKTTTVSFLIPAATVQLVVFAADES